MEERVVPGFPFVTLILLTGEMMILCFIFFSSPAHWEGARKICFLLEELQQASHTYTILR